MLPFWWSVTNHSWTSLLSCQGLAFKLCYHVVAILHILAWTLLLPCTVWCLNSAEQFLPRNAGAGAIKGDWGWRDANAFLFECVILGLGPVGRLSGGGTGQESLSLHSLPYMTSLASLQHGGPEYLGIRLTWWLASPSVGVPNDPWAEALRFLITRSLSPGNCFHCILLVTKVARATLARYKRVRNRLNLSMQGTLQVGREGPSVPINRPKAPGDTCTNASLSVSA